MATEHIWKLPISSEEELANFIQLAFGVRIPNRAVAKGHTSPWRAFADAYFAKDPIAVWHASRGFGGKSYMLALLGLVEALTLKVDVKVLGGSGEQSINVQNYISEDFYNYENSPKDMWRFPPAIRSSKIKWGNSIYALMASSKSVRGPHPVRLRLDECIAGDSLISTPTGIVKMRDLQPGDIIYAYNGFTICQGVVKYKRHTGDKPTLSFNLSNGRSLVCTSNHKVLTNDGWKRAEECQSGEMLYGMPEGTPQELPRTRQDRTLHNMLEQEAGCGGTSLSGLRKETSRTENEILPGLLSETNSRAKESLCGLWGSDYPSRNQVSSLQFQKQSTQETLLHRLRDKAKTARDETLSEVLAQGIIQNGWASQNDSGQGDGDEEQERTIESRSTMPGIARHIRTGLAKSSPNRTLDSGLYHKTEQLGNRSSRVLLAQQTNSDRTGRKEKKISGIQRIQGIIPENRNDAYLDLSTIEILSITPGPITDVWDITVPGLHSFIAEGVVVHNCDEMSLPIFDAALGQPMSKVDPRTGQVLVPTQIVASSTHQYPDKTMSEVLARANAKGWPIYRWGYQETSMAVGGWLHLEDIADKKEIVTTRMWETEYDLEEPAPESLAIDLMAIEQAFDPALGEFAGRIGEYIEIEGPVEGGRYSTGADWAKEQDFTTITTLRTDVLPWRCVAFERRQKESWPRMIGRFDTRCERYKTKRGRSSRGKNAHDVTGIGDVIDDIIEAKADGVIMKGRTRQNLFTNYIVAMEKGEIVYPFIEWVYNEHKGCSNSALYGSGHPPDSIVSGAMAIHAAGRKGSGRGA